MFRAMSNPVTGERTITRQIAGPAKQPLVHCRFVYLAGCHGQRYLRPSAIDGDIQSSS